jgi:hypothetical protein
MSVLYANFSITKPGKTRLELASLSPKENESINDRLETMVRVLKEMDPQSTLAGIDIQISEPSKEVIEMMIHEKIINKDNSSTLNKFLTNFYKHNETDVTQLININVHDQALTPEMLDRFFNPTINVPVGINLEFPGSDDVINDVIQNRSRLSAYIILWYTIIAIKLEVASGGGRKRLSGVRRSSNNKRYKSRGPSKHKRRTRHTTRRRTKRRHRH